MTHPRYRSLREIQSGASARVFEGLAIGEAGFVRRVAIKRLRSEHLADPVQSAAFVDEARFLTAIQHPNVISILDFGVVEGAPFQVLELVDGPDLGTVIREGGALPLSLALFVAGEVAKGLVRVHHAKDRFGRPLGLIHRDVTPRNILLDKQGLVKLCDFGVAFALIKSTHTRTGFTKGTPAYMAPEQRGGAPVDARSDVYALGRVLLEACTGQLEPPAPGALPPDVVALLASATAPDPAKRPASAEGLLSALNDALRRRSDPDLSASLERHLSWIAGKAVPTQTREAALAHLFDFEPSGGTLADGTATFRLISTTPMLTPPVPALTPAAARVTAGRSRAGVWIAAGGVLIVSVAAGALLAQLATRPAPGAGPAEIPPRVVAIAPASGTEERPAPIGTASPSSPGPKLNRLLRRSMPPERRAPEPTAAGPADANVLAEARRRLALEGLIEDDVDPSLWRRVESGDVQAWAALEAAILEARSSPKVLLRRLRGLGLKLRARSGHAPEGQVERWEAEYFRLRMRCRDDLAAEDRDLLLKAVDALDAELSPSK